MPGLPDKPAERHASPSVDPAAAGRLRLAVDALRAMSRRADPVGVIRAFRRDTRELFAFDRVISLSRRGLRRPAFRVTHSDLWPDDVDVWRHPAAMPVLHGGLLAELVWSGEPRLVHDFSIAPDDPAADQLAGTRHLLAVPHFDDGEPLNMVVHLWNDATAFDASRVPEVLLLSGMFGRAVKGLVVARTLREAQKSLTSHNRIMGELGDVVIEQARQLKRHADELEDRVRQRTAELDEAHDDAIYMLAVASEQKDKATGDHVRRVESLTRRLAGRMGFAQGEAAAMGRAAILHDVGKLHVPDAVLQKPGPLTPEENDLMRQHAPAGERILGDRPAFAAARRIARSHHEDFDGTGYPDGLAGDAIPIEARIVHVVDVYDALTNARPYKAAWNPDAALQHLTGNAGAMFDPDVVRVFTAMAGPDHGTAP